MARIRHKGWSGLGGILVVGMLALGVLMVSPSLGSAKSIARRPAPAQSTATVARTVSLNETGRLRLTSKHNFTLNERGSASGTIAGVIYVHLTAVSSTRVAVQVNIYPQGGSISGAGTGAYRRKGTTAEFYGSMSFSRGTGRYARVHGSGLSFSGTIEESSNDAITVHVNGRVSG